MRAGAPWSLPLLCFSRLYDQHRDFKSAILRSSGTNAYRVLHSGTFLIAATSTASEWFFIHLRVHYFSFLIVVVNPLFSSTLIHPSHCLLPYILNPLYKSILFRLVFPLVFSSLSFLSILLAFTVSHLSLPSPSFTSRAPPTLSLSLSRGWPKRHECCSRVVRRVPKLSLN